MLRLLLVCGLLVVVASPTARAWIRPHLAPILNPAYEWSVRSRVSEIARTIEAERAANHEIPMVGPIPDFVRRHYFQKDSHLDPWGTPYHLLQTADGLQVASAGPDRQIGTEDDILSPPVGTEEAAGRLGETR